jgi:hypothetical protein
MRRLSSMKIGDAFPLKSVNALVACLATKQIFSVVDVQDGYWNIPVKDSARHLTAVRTVHGLLKYTMMTMGLSNASAHSQRFVNAVCEVCVGLGWRESLN